MDDDILVTTQTTYCLRVSIREPGSPTHRTTHEPIASKRLAEPRVRRPISVRVWLASSKLGVRRAEAGAARQSLPVVGARLGSARLVAGSLLARALCGESGSQARVSTRAGSTLSVLSRGSYSQVPVLWKVRSVEYANTAKRDEGNIYINLKVPGPRLENNSVALVQANEVVGQRNKCTRLHNGTGICFFPWLIKNIRERKHK
ncbi:hypothetical protein PR048_022053 [Dryococelus australis]|uniref:Uncharacterized protein n=1 Tax=Dryococelus australis TaxID=614101 RepID=A0ABQ9H050_9NEOP|nr:hypothetical protein PR048_022053 [Dryococelus australis]